MYSSDDRDVPFLKAVYLSAALNPEPSNFNNVGIWNGKELLMQIDQIKRSTVCRDVCRKASVEMVIITKDFCYLILAWTDEKSWRSGWKNLTILNIFMPFFQLLHFTLSTFTWLTMVNPPPPTYLLPLIINSMPSSLLPLQNVHPWSVSMGALVNCVSWRRRRHEPLSLLNINHFAT